MRKNRMMHMTMCALAFLSVGSCSRQTDSTSIPAFTPGAGADEMANHIVALREMKKASADVPALFPNLDRETAYEIQMLTLAAAEDKGAKLTGWKMGNTILKTDDDVTDLTFGFSLGTQMVESGAIVPATNYVNGDVMLEAEITLILGKDLPGPEVSREEAIAAIDSICGSIEIIDERILSVDKNTPKTMEHMIADDMSHGGTILGPKQVNLDEIDINAESVTVAVDGEERSTGYGRYILGSGDVVEVLVWLANELPKHGRHLKAGNYIQTGSLYDNPTIAAGQKAVVSFSTLGKIEIELGGGDLSGN